MNVDFTIINPLVLTLFYIAVVLIGLMPTKSATAPEYFSKPHTSGWFKSGLTLFAGSLAFILIVMTYFKRLLPILPCGGYLIINWICVALMILAFNSDSTTQNQLETLYKSQAIRRLLNTYRLISDYVFKLPLIIFVYGSLAMVTTGSGSAIMLVLLFTISGILLMIRGVTTIQRTGTFAGICILIGLFLSLFVSNVSSLQFENIGILSQLSDHAPSSGFSGIITIICLVTGSWIVDLGFAHQAAISRDVVSRRKTLAVCGLFLMVFFGLTIFSANRANIHPFDFGNRAKNLAVLPEPNIFSLIVINSLFVTALVSMFQTMSETLANTVFRVWRPTTTSEGNKLVSRLTIVFTVIFAILLTPLLATISPNVIQTLLMLYLLGTIPVMITTAAGYFPKKIPEFTFRFTLIGGWVAGLLMAILIVFKIIDASDVLFLYAGSLLINIVIFGAGLLFHRKLLTAQLASLSNK